MASINLLNTAGAPIAGLQKHPYRLRTLDNGRVAIEGQDRGSRSWCMLSVYDDQKRADAEYKRLTGKAPVYCAHCDALIPDPSSAIVGNHGVYCSDAHSDRAEAGRTFSVGTFLMGAVVGAMLLIIAEVAILVWKL